MIRAAKQTVVVFILMLAVQAEAASVRFFAVGDILPDRGIRRSTTRRGVDYPFTPVAPILKAGDLSFGNLEGCLDTSGVPLPKMFVFRGDAEFADGLSRAGFDVLSLANNHSLDGGRESLVKTKMLLENHNLLVVGAGNNQDEARSPLVLERNGLRFGFLAFCRLYPDGIEYLADKPATAYASEEDILSEIGKVRDRVDFVIVSLHWGIEGELFPTTRQERFAHRAVEAGADLVLGHHPHVLQGVEFYRGRPILYSLGNFVFDNPALEQRQTAVFGCEFEKGRIARPSLIPFLSEHLQPRPAGGDDLQGILKRIQEASARFQVEARADGERIALAERGGRDVFEVPMERFRAGKKSVELLPSQVRLVEEGVPSAVFRLPAQDGAFRSAAMIVEGKTARLYALLGHPGQEGGERLAVLFIDLGKKRLGPLLRDRRDGFHPGKLELTDVDGDGKKELAAGVFKDASSDTEPSSRLFLFHRPSDAGPPLWLDSLLGGPIVDFAFRDIDGDGADEVFSIEKTGNGTRRMACYRWRSFAFERFAIIEDPTDRRDFAQGVPDGAF